MPAFDATYAASGISPIERRPITDATLTIDAAAVAAHRGARQGRTARTARSRLRSSTRAKASVVICRAGPVAPAPALFTSPSRRPWRSMTVVDQPLAVGRVRDVARDRVRAGQLGAQRLEAVGTARGEHRDRAGAGQREGELLAEPRARAGDDDDSACACCIPGSKIHLKSLQFYNRRVGCKPPPASRRRKRIRSGVRGGWYRSQLDFNSGRNALPQPRQSQTAAAAAAAVVAEQARGDPRGRDGPVRPRGLRALQVGRRGGCRRHRLDGAVSLLRVQAPLPLRDHGRGAGGRSREVRADHRRARRLRRAR